MAYIQSSDVLRHNDFLTTDHEDIIVDLIQQATVIIQTYTGRDFEGASSDVATRYFDMDVDVDGNTLYLDKDLLSVGTDNIVAGSDTINSSDYVTLPRNEAPYYGIQLLSQSPRVWTNNDSDGNSEYTISVHGTWAYSTSPPADIQRACERLVIWLYDQRNPGGIDRPVIADGVMVMPPSLPEDVRSILNPYRRATFG